MTDLSILVDKKHPTTADTKRPLRQSSRDPDTIELLVVLALYRNDTVNDLQHPRIHQRMKVLAKQYPLGSVCPRSPDVADAFVLTFTEGGRGRQRGYPLIVKVHRAFYSAVMVVTLVCAL